MQMKLPIPDLVFAKRREVPAPSDRVFCNRNLRMSDIDWVGFDMDYTLAIYRQEEMDRVSVEVVLEKLVAQGYPEHLLALEPDHHFPIRGLLIDRKLGNVLKMDRYKYVKRAYHGLRELTREERRRAYHTRRINGAASRYNWVDTLYALSEVTLYAGVIDAMDKQGQPVDPDKLFRDIRAAMDLSHQDGSILDQITGDLPRFIERDPRAFEALHKLRSSGKKLFLLTNSWARYSDTMMTYLFGDELPGYPSWRHMFDLVVTAAKKPSFFQEERPFTRFDGEDYVAHEGPLARGEIYANGNIALLQEALGVSGDRVLYVGDHIFGDVLRAKKDSSWRTVMVVQEMEHELETTARSQEELAMSDAMEAARVELYDELREHQARLKVIQSELEVERTTARESARALHRKAIERSKAHIQTLEHELETLETTISDRYHTRWGPLFKAGGEVSSFGDQVETYSCLYTSRVSNLANYSAMHYFLSPRDRMPHER